MADTIRPRRLGTYIFNDFLDSEDILTGNEKLLMIMLWRYGDGVNNHIFPSLNTLAAKTGWSKRTVQNTIHSLCEKGVLRKIQRKSDSGDYTSNEYVPMDSPEIWEARNAEDLAAAVTDAEENYMVAALRALGYDVAKKETASADQSKDAVPQALSKDSKSHSHDTMSRQKKQSKSRKQVAQVSTTEQFQQDSQTSVPTMSRYLQELRTE